MRSKTYRFLETLKLWWCCSCNFSQISKNFGPSLLILLKVVCSHFATRLDCLRPVFLAFQDFVWVLRMFWTIGINRFYDVLLFLRFGQGLKQDFQFLFFRGQLDIALIIKSFHWSLVSLLKNISLCDVSKGIMTLIGGRRLIEVHCCGPRID